MELTLLHIDIRDWLQQTNGIMRNPVRKYFKLPPLPDRDIPYCGPLTIAQEANVILGLNEDDHIELSKYIPKIRPKYSIDDELLPKN